MPEQNQDVNTATPSSAEPVVKEVVKQEVPATDTQEQKVQTLETPTTTTPAQTGNSDVDEFGVPWKNRAFEWKRKTEEIVDKLPSMLEEKITSALSQQTGQRKYTVDELELFANSQADNPANVQWARSEIRRIEREEQANIVKGELNKWRSEQEANGKRQQALAYVQNTYPEVFIKNTAGQITGLNQNSPMAQHLNGLMQDSRYANDPEGLMVAADIAYGRTTRSQQAVAQQQQQKLKEEVGSLKRNTLVEGGNRAPVPTVPEHRAAIEKAKKTGNLKDIAAALNAMDKARQAGQGE
jgi:hypothetical protein